MSPLRLLSLAVLVVTTSTQSVFLAGAAFFVMGPELGITTRGLGFLTALFFVAASISSLLIRNWVQRVGWQRAMRVNALVAGATSVAIATVVDHWVGLAVCMAVAACAYGAANPAGNQAIADAVPADRRATFTGIKYAGIPLSTLFAGIAVPTVILTLGWRSAFLIAAAGSLVVVALVPRGRVEVVRHVGRERKREPRPLSPKDLNLLAAGSSFAVFGAVSLGTFGVTAAIDIGLSPEMAGWLQTAGAFASIAVRTFAGWFTDRTGGEGFRGIMALAGVGVLVFLGLAFVLPPWFSVLVILGYATGWGWPGLMTFSVINGNAGTAAASSGVTQAGVFLGAGLAPLLLAAIADRYGFPWMWPVVSGALAVAVVLIGVVARRGDEVPSTV